MKSTRDMPENGTPRDRPHGFKQAMAQAPLAVPLVVTEFSSRGEFDRPLSPGGLSCVEAKPFTGSVEKDLMAQRGVDKHDR